MGSGIARQIKNRFPEAYAADCQTQRGDLEKLGKISWAKCKGKIVFNLYGQFRYGTERRHLDYDALKSALEAMQAQLLTETQRANWKIGFPKYMGCGLAGGDWSIVSNIIESVFVDEDIYIYSL